MFPVFLVFIFRTGDSYRHKRRHDSSSEESDAEELDNFYNDLIDFNDTFSSEEQGDEDPLGRSDELDSDFGDDPLGDAEDCATDFEFHDPVEADEYNFDEFDDGENFLEDFESEPDSDTEEEDSDDTDENVATVSKGKTTFCIVLLNFLVETWIVITILLGCNY